MGAICVWRWANAGASCEDACRLRVAIARRVAFTMEWSGVTRCRHEGLGKERLVDEKKFVPLRLVLGGRW